MGVALGKSMEGHSEALRGKHREASLSFCRSHSRDSDIIVNDDT